MGGQHTGWSMSSVRYNHLSPGTRVSTYLQASILGGNVGARRASDAVVIAFCLTTACQQQARLLIGAHHATLFGEARAGGVGCGS